MKAHLIDKLLSTPWNISPFRGRHIIGAMVAALMKGERPEHDIFGDALPTMRTVGDVAVIPITGRLMLNVEGWFKDFGFAVTDPNDIEEELATALNDPEIRMVALEINSPGGESVAGEKLFDLVEAANRRKPVIAWCADGHMACSSAYQSAAPALAIYTGKFANVGSIGTYLALMDDTAMWEQMGVTWRVLRSGAMKGAGEDGYSDEQLAWLQSEVDAYGNRFRRGVKKYRTAIADEDLQGQWFGGTDAATKGFTAGIAKNLDAAIARARKLV